MSREPSWSADDVLRAADAWVWVPEDAERFTTADLDVVAYPPHFAMPTQVLRSSAARPTQELVEQAREVSRGWGRSELFWWVTPGSPQGLEEVLGSRYASHVSRQGRLPGRARPSSEGRTRTWRDSRCGQGSGGHLGPNPAPRRFHPLRRGALLPDSRAGRVEGRQRTTTWGLPLALVGEWELPRWALGRLVAGRLGR